MLGLSAFTGVLAQVSVELIVECRGEGAVTLLLLLVAVYITAVVAVVVVVTVVGVVVVTAEGRCLGLGDSWPPVARLSF